jgi:hypothetical protein
VVLKSTTRRHQVSSTGLSPSVVDLSRSFDYNQSSHMSCPQPPRRKPSWVWAVPLSLAATKGIEFSFSSSGYLDVSVPPVCLQLPMNSAEDTWSLLHVGFPIRKSPDRSLLATPRSISVLIPSFIGSWCQGIHPMLLLA